jgi:cytochrome b involved in lipid metabolism
MIEQAGVDATEAFEEIGHSEDARELLKEMYIGDLDTSVCYRSSLMSFFFFMPLHPIIFAFMSVVLSTLLPFY